MPIQRILGIDFGTSTSLIKVKTYEDGEPLRAADLADYVRFEGVNDTIPTLICHDETHKEYIMGHKAAANSGYGELFSNFKIDLVSDDEEVREKAYKHVKMFFEYMYEVYDDQRSQFPTCDEEITYVSYPVKWVETDGLDEKMKSIAAEAGFKNVEGMDEASAAIHSVWVQQREILSKLNKDSINVLLIDMGAGTTDLAICRYTIGEKSVERLNTWPQDKQHALFGGREIDESLWELIKEYLLSCGIKRIINESQYLPSSKAWKENSLSPALGNNRSENRCSFIQPLLNTAEELKPFPTTDRTSFEDRLKSYLEEFPNLVNGIINDTEDFTNNDVDLVIFAGGHSQWYFANEMISGAITRFGEIDLPQIKSDPWRVVKLPRPHETVALGMVFQPLAAEVKEETQVIEDEPQIPVDPEAERQESGSTPESYEKSEGSDITEENDYIKQIRKAAEQGDAGEQNHLGLLYKHGAGVVKDEKEAIKWFRMSAEQGNAEGQNQLGEMYFNGLGVPKDDNEAVKRFIMAAVQGNSNGQANLGYIYLKNNVILSDDDIEKLKQLYTEHDDLEAKHLLYALEIIDGSVWKEMNSEETASMYALALLLKIKPENFLGSRHLMPFGTMKAQFEGKLPGALSYAGRLVQGEFPIYIYDYTVLGSSAKNGILATNKTLHYAFATAEGKKCEWADIISFNGNEFKTARGTTGYFPLATNDNVKVNQVLVLHQMWKDLR